MLEFSFVRQTSFVSFEQRRRQDWQVSVNDPVEYFKYFNSPLSRCLITFYFSSTRLNSKSILLRPDTLRSKHVVRYNRTCIRISGYNGDAINVSQLGLDFPQTPFLFSPRGGLSCIFRGSFLMFPFPFFFFRGYSRRLNKDTSECINLWCLHMHERNVFFSLSLSLSLSTSSFLRTPLDGRLG